MIYKYLYYIILYIIVLVLVRIIGVYRGGVLLCCSFFQWKLGCGGSEGFSGGFLILSTMILEFPEEIELELYISL